MLRKSVTEKEQELIAAKGLIQEKELLLSQETEKRAKEIQEMQGKLTEKVSLALSGRQISLRKLFSCIGEIGRCEEFKNREGPKKEREVLFSGIVTPRIPQGSCWP